LTGADLTGTRSGNLHSIAENLMWNVGTASMDLLRWVAEGSNIFGLIVYCAGMTLILGTLAWANYVDHRRDKEQIAKR
jgi:hypothetical protein